jgi:hypothetical protein
MLKDMAACALAAHGDHGFRPCAIEVGVFDWCFRQLESRGVWRPKLS